MKLGKLPPRVDPRTFQLSKYIKALPPPPDNCGYVDKIHNWQMLGNDVYGDCVEAAAGHCEMQWTAYSGIPFTPTTQHILDDYSAITGFNQNDPSTDNGTVPLDMLKYWRNTGIASRKIASFMAVDWKNHSEVKQAIELFGNILVGIRLPFTAQTPVNGDNGLPCWSLQDMQSPNSLPGSWGGHMIPIVGYGIDAKGNKGMMGVTWGGTIDVTWGFGDTYYEEAWVVLSQDWIDSRTGLAPSGFDLDALKSDIALL
jgi:hypothetical protein